LVVVVLSVPPPQAATTRANANKTVRIFVREYFRCIIGFLLLVTGLE
jgi:hypothetical protein